ncbi:MAG: 4-alpha-glucanotransferase [Anaerolineae bacterium]|jgi:4-alpha-glucanotransferase|nr:4-alpha-glucanotransferase [Anaerolineae bacterium]
MSYKRSSGILLHPTSLPGPDGIGDFGPEAYAWVDFLAKSNTHLWQVLPLGPTGYGDSPYQCFSAFAGNPYLISTTLLLDQGLLERTDLIDRPDFPSHQVDYGRVIEWKIQLLKRAYRNFKKKRNATDKKSFLEFIDSEKWWLQDFATFMALKEAQNGAAWSTWQMPFRRRDKDTIDAFIEKNRSTIEMYSYWQFLFFEQWTNLKKYCNENGIKIIGDIPIFIAADSSDAWAHPELFHFDDQFQPTVVAGVPPDYFSPTGQLWGNPLYRWSKHEESSYSWWIDRFRATLRMYDIIRLDHFRGFSGYWEVPADKPTAEIGKWKKGPGRKLFDTLVKALGDLPILAEDLGVITRDVVRLRERYHFPSMKVFQFAFSTDAGDPFLPHNYPSNCVAYTGTHDNDTVLGWYLSAPEAERDFCRRYMARSGQDISWDMIRQVWSSVSVFAIAPMQDLLGLGNEARMNFPGKASGNWGWRMLPGSLNEELLGRLKEANYLYLRDHAQRADLAET